MKRIYLVFPLLIALSFVSCKKEEQPEPVPQEDYRDDFIGDFHFKRTYNNGLNTTVLEWDGTFTKANQYENLWMSLSNGGQQLFKADAEGNLKYDGRSYGRITPNGDYYHFWDDHFPSGTYVSYQLHGDRQ